MHFKRRLLAFSILFLLLAFNFYIVGADYYGSWTRYSGNPIFEKTDYDYNDAPNNGRLLKSPDTGQPMRYNGFYWMCFSDSLDENQNNSIHLIKSLDLFTWSWDSIAFSNQDAEAQDAEARIQCTDFIYVENASSPYWIFYFGQDSETDDRTIRVAYSSDMKTWIREQNNPIFDPSYEAEDFNVWKYDDTDWIAVYERNNYSGNECVYHAAVTSTYPNGTWSDKGSLFDDSGDAGWSANPVIIGDADNSIFVVYEEVDYPEKSLKIRSVKRTDFFDYNSWGIRGEYILDSHNSGPGYEDKYCVPNGICFSDTRDTAEIIVCYTANDQSDKCLALIVSDFRVNVRESLPPKAPYIYGPREGRVKTELCWTVQSFDPNYDSIKYFVKWGDGTVNETDYIQSGVPVRLCHTYNKKGSYVINTLAEDETGLKSNLSTFGVKVPRSKEICYNLLDLLFERFLMLERLLGWIRYL